MKLTPIPLERELSWAEVYAQPLDDCQEELVPLALNSEQVVVSPTCGQMHIREGLLSKLLLATCLLPDSLRLVVMDGWRPQQRQSRASVARTSVQRQLSALERLNQRFVSWSSQDRQGSSSHSTGGALDLILTGPEGISLFLGSPYDYPGEISHTRYFERQLEQGATLRDREQEALENRRLLYHVMIAAGFVNYASEWWHFEYGTQRWAAACGHKAALYGNTCLAQKSLPIPRAERLSYPVLD